MRIETGATYSHSIPPTSALTQRLYNNGRRVKTFTTDPGGRCVRLQSALQAQQHELTEELRSERVDVPMQPMKPGFEYVDLGLERRFQSVNNTSRGPSTGAPLSGADNDMNSRYKFAPN